MSESKLKADVKAEAADAPMLGAKLKEIAADRAATVARIAPTERAEFMASAETGTPIPPMFAIDGDADLVAAADAYEKAQEEMRKAKEERMAAKANWLDSEYLYFIKCRYPHPEGMSQHGLYLKGYPHTNTVKGTEWKAGYKPTFEEPWHGEILCQICLRYMAREVPLGVTPIRTGGVANVGSFEIDPRWLWKRPKNAQRLMLENETRARLMGYTTGNIGLQEAEKRSRDAGLTVVQ